MQVSVESTKGLERRLRVVLPAEQVDTEINQRVSQLQKGRMRGFRAGKLPKKIVDKRYGKHILYEVAEELMKKSFHEAVKEHKIHVAGMPHIEPTSLEVGKPLEYVATFEVYPEISFKSLEGVTILKQTAEISEADVDKTLDKIRQQYADWNVVDRIAKTGDRVVIDFEGRLNGELFDGGKAEKFPIEIGSGTLIPGFEEKLVGTKAGADLIIDVTFPEQYQAPHLAGKAATFAVHVIEVLESTLPEVNEEFAKKLAVEGGVAGLRNELQQNMQRELAKQIQLNLKKRVFAKLTEINEVELPKSLIVQQIQYMQQQAAHDSKGKLKAEDFPIEMFEKEAEKQVKMSLLIHEVIDHYKLQVENEKVRAKVEEMAALYPQPDRVVAWYYSNESMLEQVKATVLEDQVAEKLLQEATIQERKTTYNKIMNPRSEEETRSAPKGND